MLKFIGVLSVAFSSIGFGVVGYTRMKRREQELIDFRRLLTHLQDTLESLQSGLQEAFLTASNHCATEFKKVLDEFLRLLKNGDGIRASAAWQMALETADLSLTEEDEMILKEFGGGLDGHSFDSQKRNISFAISKIEKQIEDASEQRLQNGKLTLKLGVFCGVGAVLLLV